MMVRRADQRSTLPHVPEEATVTPTRNVSTAIQVSQPQDEEGGFEMGLSGEEF